MLVRLSQRVQELTRISRVFSTRMVQILEGVLRFLRKQVLVVARSEASRRLALNDAARTWDARKLSHLPP